MPTNNGGPAFPMPSGSEPRVNQVTHYNEGMTLLDWFAGETSADPALVKAVREMDDQVLAIFARRPGAELDFLALSEHDKSLLRFELEAAAIARVRFIQADAMLQERMNWVVPEEFRDDQAGKEEKS